MLFAWFQYMYDSLMHASMPYITLALVLQGSITPVKTYYIVVGMLCLDVSRQTIESMMALMDVCARRSRSRMARKPGIWLVINIFRLPSLLYLERERKCDSMLCTTTALGRARHEPVHVGRTQLLSALHVANWAVSYPVVQLTAMSAPVPCCTPLIGDLPWLLAAIDLDLRW